jgi:GT2 family glycosyltransferase
MERMAVAVISYNTRDLLRGVIDSALADGASTIIVADNGSSDGSVDMIRAEYPMVRVVVNHSNPGYGVASNEAIALTESQYVLLLNSDVVFRPGTLKALTDYLDEHPRAGIVGPRLTNADGTLQRSCHEFPRPFVSLLEHSWVGAVVCSIPVLRRRYLRTWTHDHARPVPWVVGAALAIRKEPFARVGGFDPSFFMYFEEVDLAYRMMRAGWETHFAPVAEITHFGGASTQQMRTAMFGQYYRAALQFYDRHRSQSATARAERAFRFALRSHWIIGAVKRALTVDAARRRSLADFMDDCTIAIREIDKRSRTAA